jgi:uncharacterized membrane protein
MVLMALDHARDYFCGATVQPTNLATTTVPLFLTRWVTHFCAPVFVLLAGVGARRFGRQEGSARLSRFLVTRGLWLIFLEVAVVSPLMPVLAPRLTILGPLWAIGCSMIVLAVLCRLPGSAPLAVGAVIVAGHNLLDPLDTRLARGFGALWPFLHQQRLLPVAGRAVLVAYPVLPWIGVMALGYALGGALDRPVEERRRLFLRLGLAASAAFVALRALDGYGDPARWSRQPRGPVFTVLSFLNCTKYPPSLLFLLMTLGPAVALLGLVEGRGAWRWLVVYGRTPLLFFLAHLALLRGSALLVRPQLPLWGGYLAWPAVVALLYPLCRWYAAFKARRPERWLGYL